MVRRRARPDPARPDRSRGRDHRSARAQRRRQDHGHPHDHRRPRPRPGHGAHLRPRPHHRRRGGAPPLRRGLRQAGALRPPVGPRQPRVRGRAVRAGPPRRRPHRRCRRPVRHRRGPRPEGRRVLDRHEDPPGAGPLRAPRPRTAALRRAHLRPGSRVVARRARAHPGDDRRGPHRRHVHPPAGGGGGPGRPDHRPRCRHRSARRQPGGAHPPLLATEPRPPRRREHLGPGPGGRLRRCHGDGIHRAQPSRGGAGAARRPRPHPGPRGPAGRRGRAPRPAWSPTSRPWRTSTSRSAATTASAARPTSARAWRPCARPPSSTLSPTRRRSVDRHHRPGPGQAATPLA